MPYVQADAAFSKFTDFFFHDSFMKRGHTKRKKCKYVIEENWEGDWTDLLSITLRRPIFVTASSARQLQIKASYWSEGQHYLHSET